VECDAAHRPEVGDAIAVEDHGHAAQGSGAGGVEDGHVRASWRAPALSEKKMAPDEGRSVRSVSSLTRPSGGIAMSDAPEDEVSLSPDARGRIDNACDLFEDAMLAGQGPRIEDFLAGTEGREREALLGRLLELELEPRRKRGEVPAPEDYLHRFPADTPTILGAWEAVPKVPGYEVLEELGRGGMGVVYKARQLKADRFVALKMLRAGSSADQEELRRFQREAETVARLQHPHVVQLFEVGEHEGRPYFCMSLCPGGSLANQLGGKPMAPRPAGELVEVLARAVQVAHDAGVIHRDLKPGNVLFGADGAAKIADFGLAKRLDQAGPTISNVIVGTPAYMPPEQARGSAPLTTAVDVYALGAVLYECLTGRPPFKAATTFDMLQKVVSEEPEPPSRLNRKVPRDLETICLKCLRKEPHQRYDSARALAGDLRKFLEGRPVKARPVTLWERAGKWARRQPGVAALVALVALLIALLAGSIGWDAWQTYEAFQETRAQRNVSLAERYLEVGQRVHAQEALRECPERLRRWEWYYLDRLCRPQRSALAGHAQKVLSLEYSPDGALLATASMDGTVRLWQPRTGATVQTLRAHRGRAHRACFIAGGKQLLTAGEDNVVKRWDVATGKMLERIGEGKLVASSASGHRIAVVTDLGNRPGRVVRVLNGSGVEWHRWEKGREVVGLAVSADGRFLGLGGYGDLHEVWDLESGKEVKKVRLKSPPVESGKTYWAVAFSPPRADGRRFFVAGIGQPVLWDLDTGKIVRHFAGMGSLNCTTLAFSPDGGKLAATYRDGWVRVWDVDKGLMLRSPRPYNGNEPQPIIAAVFSPDGKDLAFSHGEVVTIETIFPGPLARSAALRGHSQRTIEALAFAPDGKWLATRAGREIIFWDVQGRALRQRVELRKPPREGSNLAFHPNRSPAEVVCGQSEGPLASWVAPGQPAAPPSVAARGARFVALGGPLLATCDAQNLTTVWDLAQGSSVSIPLARAGDVSGLALAPGGNRLAVCGTNDLAGLWNARTGKQVRALEGHRGTVTCVTFSPDGRWLATGGTDRTVRIWRANSSRARHVLEGHWGYVTGVAFSRDGERLASCGMDGTIKVWDVRTGQEVLTLSEHTGPVTALAFSPDGHLLASCSHDGTVRIWDGRPFEE
jgi:WD40 repeat protein/tRNA A-37 threonylcarbamoyl transferase component Bud32